MAGLSDVGSTPTVSTIKIALCCKHGAFLFNQRGAVDLCRRKLRTG